MSSCQQPVASKFKNKLAILPEAGYWQLGTDQGNLRQGLPVWYKNQQEPLLSGRFVARGSRIEDLVREDLFRRSF